MIEKGRNFMISLLVRHLGAFRADSTGEPWNPAPGLYFSRMRVSCSWSPKLMV